MDIEQLTKVQIVLLTLLVSFVTSIATGIVTITLLDQAPPAITQTINRVVERTVERVVPGETQKASVITKETTVVVNEEDLLTKAIEKNTARIGKIYRITDEGSVFVGIGAIVSKSGIVAVATDRSITVDGAKYSVKFSDGRSIPAVILQRSVDKPTALLELIFTEEDGNVPAGVEYGDINSLKLGQSILTLSGVSQLNVATGIIASLNETSSEVTTVGDDGNMSTTTISILKSINTNINQNDIEKGGPLMNLFGDVVGISTLDSRLISQSSFTPIQIVKNQLAQVADERAQVAGE